MTLRWLIAPLLFLAPASGPAAQDDPEAGRALLAQSLDLLGEQALSSETMERYAEFHRRAWALGDVELAHDGLRRIATLSMRPPASLETADRLHDVLNSALSVSDLKGASLLGSAILSIREESFGPQDPRLIGILTSMGDLSALADDYGGANQFYERAICIAHGAREREPYLFSLEQARFAEYKWVLGDYEEAQRSYEQAILEFEAVPVPANGRIELAGGGSADYWGSRAGAWRGLGEVQYARGRYREARMSFERALWLDERHRPIFGARAHGLSKGLEGLGRVYIALGDVEAARACFERAVGLWPLSSARMDLASLLASMGEVEDAEFHRATAAVSEGLGTDTASLRAARVLISDARVLARTGRLLPAIRACESGLEIQERILGVHHAGSGRARQLLGTLLRDGGDVEQARVHLVAALDTLTTALGASHPETLSCRHDLAMVMAGRGATSEAAEALEEVVQARHRQLGLAHVTTLEAMRDLARLKATLGVPGESRDLYWKVLGVLQDQLPGGHPDLQAIRQELSEVLDALGDEAEAARLRSAGVTSNAFPPELVLMTPSSDEAQLDRRWITLEAVVTDGVGVEDVQIEQDGQAVSALAHPGALQFDRTGRQAVLRLRVQIPDDRAESRVTLVAFNRHGRASRRRTLTLRYRAPGRDLYVLGLAVQDYEDDSMDLAYPVNDLESIVTRFRAEGGGLYDEVHILTFEDAGVDVAAVRRARDTFLLRARPEDTLLVFAAGHGVRTELGDYYFLTPGCTGEDPYEGIDRGTLESLVMWERLHAQRRILLLDSCFSGSPAGTRNDARGSQLYRQEDVDDAVLGAREGLYILAASTDDGFAREMGGHGLFTRALLEGLEGAADRDGNGYIEVEELKDHAATSVHALSRGRQRPTVPTVRGGENFPVASIPGG